jgi:hypothetical protein
MRTGTVRGLLLACAVVAAWELGVRPLIVGPARSHAGAGEAPAARDDAELRRMFEEDQADRTSVDGKPLDWPRISQRDKKREARVKELYRADKLHTGADFYHAAMVLQHASRPEDYLLAHELCVVAVGKADKRARWLAAASEDRFLMALKRPQRFATQYRKDGPDAPVRLYQTDPEVTDGLRGEFGAPSLAKAREREAQYNAAGAKKK